MLFKLALVAALVGQILAAILALRLNLRYRIYSAWLFLSAAAFVMAIARGLTLIDIWDHDLSASESLVTWTGTIAALMVSLFFVAGMALIEPFFQAIAQAQDALQREHRQLQTAMRTAEEELRLARRVQQNLLPKSDPNLPGIEVAGGSIPAEWTGGDYFDYLTLEDGAAGFVVADVSGHGLGPAILMSSTRASIRALCKRCTDLATVLQEANLAVSEAVSGGGFVTAFALRMSPGGDQFDYAAAGHTALWFPADGERQTLAGDSPPLGVVTDLSVDTFGPHPWRVGDILVLLTDGIVETRDPAGQMFGEERLAQLIEDHRNDHAAEIVDRIFEVTREYRRDAAQADDVTVVIIKRV